MSDDAQLTASKLAEAIGPLVQAGATWESNTIYLLAPAAVASLTTSQSAQLTVTQVNQLSAAALPALFAKIGASSTEQAAITAKLQAHGLLGQ